MRKSRINKKTVVGGIVIGDNNTIINCDQDRIEEAVERKYLELISSIFRHTQIQKMKKILQCIGTAIYSTLSGCLLWTLFYWMKSVMELGWIDFLLCFFLGGGVIAYLSSSAVIILQYPAAFLTNDNIVATIINIPPLLLFGYSAVCMPWRLDMEYGVLQYFIGISFSVIAFASFVGMIVIPFALTRDND